MLEKKKIPTFSKSKCWLHSGIRTELKQLVKLVISLENFVQIYLLLYKAYLLLHVLILPRDVLNLTLDRQKNICLVCLINLIFFPTFYRIWMVSSCILICIQINKIRINTLLQNWQYYNTVKSSQD